MRSRASVLMLAGLLCCLPLLLAGASPASLASKLDWIETNFWPRLFSRSPILEAKLQDFLSECRATQSSAKIKLNLTAPAMALNLIASSTKVRLRSFSIVFKGTGIAAFRANRKYSSDGNGKKQDRQTVDPEQYRQFVTETVTGNLELFKRRYEDTSTPGTKNRRNVSNKLNRSQYAQIYGKMESFFQEIQKLRFEMLKLHSASVKTKTSKNRKQNSASKQQR